MDYQNENVWSMIKGHRLSLIAYSKATHDEVLAAMKEMKKWMPNTLHTMEEKRSLTCIYEDDECIRFDKFEIQRKAISDEYVQDDVVLFHMNDHMIALKILA